jgi:copper(I)-binding protein
MRGSRLVIAGVLLALVAVGCTGGHEGIEVDDAWGRTAPSSAANAAFYMIVNGGDVDDALVSAEAEGCGVVEIHETVMNDDVMMMQHLPEGIPVVAGSVVTLEPGGMHIMCIGRTADLDPGEVFPISLEFAIAPTQVIEFEIRDQ